MIHPGDDDYLYRAIRLHRSHVVIDTHCDTTMKLARPEWDFAARHETGHVDIPRLREGGVGALFLAVYRQGPLESGEGTKAARAQLDLIAETIRRHQDQLAFARSSQEVRDAFADGRIAILIGIEGGYLIEDSLEVLREYYEKGARYLSLTHAFHTSWADSSGVHADLEPHHHGLTDFGRDVIRELNRLGMMVDVSHVSDETFFDVLEVAEAPIVATHSSCRSLSNHRRNLTGEMIKLIAESGGVVQINFSAAFIDPNHPPLNADVLKRLHEAAVSGTPYTLDHKTPLSLLVDHFDRALQLAGPTHVGIGSDFDGVPSLPVGMEDCSKLPHLTAALLRRGYTAKDMALILGENVLRVMDRCAAVAKRSAGP